MFDPDRDPDYGLDDPDAIIDYDGRWIDPAPTLAVALVDDSLGFDLHRAVMLGLVDLADHPLPK